MKEYLFLIMETNIEDFVSKFILFDRAWSYFQFRIGYMRAFWTINVFRFHQDVEKFADQQDEKVQSSGDSTDSEVEPHPLLEKFSKKGATKSVKRKCRKCTWKETLVNDSVDIILENDTYRTKLLLTNVKNTKNGICYDQVARSLVVSDLRLETKGSQFEPGCYLCAEESSLQ